MPIVKPVAVFSQIAVSIAITLLVGSGLIAGSARADASFRLEKNPQGDFKPFKVIGVPLPDFVKEYSRVTGTPVTIGGTWDKDLAGSVTLYLRHPLKPGQMTELVHRVLNDNGYAMVDAPAGNGWLIERARDARDGPLPVYDLSELPVTNRLVTAVEILKFMDAEEIARTMRGFMPANSRIIPAVHSQLLITDVGVNIRKLTSMISFLDTEAAAKRLRDFQAASPPPGPSQVCGEQRIEKLVVEKLEIQDSGGGNVPNGMHSSPGPSIPLKRVMEGAAK